MKRFALAESGEITMEYLIGLILSLVVAGFAIIVGFDRDRSFYPTVLIVIASYYVLFAVMGASECDELSISIPCLRHNSEIGRFQIDWFFWLFDGGRSPASYAACSAYTVLNN
jgi:hypothetical protein